MRILNLEGRSAERFDVIDQAARHEIEADAVDDQRNPVALDHQIIGFRRVGKAESVGGSGDPSAMAYLMDLSLRVPSADNLHAYAADLVRYARKRSALDALGSLVHRLRTDETAEGEDVVSAARR